MNQKCCYCGETFVDKYYFRHVKKCKMSKCAPEVNFDEFVCHPASTCNETSTSSAAKIPENENTEEDINQDESIQRNLVFESIEEIASEQVIAEMVYGLYDTAEPESEPTSRPMVWLVYFLAFWQYTYSVTDSAMRSLITFLHILFKVLLPTRIHGIFPRSLYLFQKEIGFPKNSFKKYVICIKCHKLYNIEESSYKLQGEMHSKKCNNILFPEHPQRARRNECGQLLMKTIISPTGKKTLYPFKIYCYKSIKESLQTLLNDPNFEDKCEAWRILEKHPEVLSDVYDGRVWKHFSDGENGYDFFNQKRNYGLMLNCDWFQPFKHISNFSVGAIYLVLLNLPRAERFKRKNVILLGLIPNMEKEPPTNSFLKPLVDELQDAWIGYQLISNQEMKIFRLALLIIGCDIPAARKLCGFLGHSAVMGCNKCKKSFPGPIGARDYSGFDFGEWTPRNDAEHRRQMIEILNAKTKTDKERLESEYGTRYSVLANLEYVDLITMTVIDPMHNLFLGTAKRMIKLWKKLNLLSGENFDQIQEKVDQAEAPSEIGKLPTKIKSGFDRFTADELKNWTIIFSIYALKGILPEEHMECWRLFVIAVQYLCVRILTKSDVTIAHGYLVRFCRRYQELYGEEAVTPNIHLHPHLMECIIDCGPIYAFWLFSFERYNGILGDVPTNNRTVEIQMMNRFLRDTHLTSMPYPDDLDGEIKECYDNLFDDTVERGTLNEVRIIDVAQRSFWVSRRFSIQNKSCWIDDENLVFPRNFATEILSRSHHEYLKEMYRYLYPDDFENLTIPGSAWKTNEMFRDGKDMFAGQFSRSHKSSYVLAHWSDGDGEIAHFNDMPLKPTPGQIIYFLKHTVFLGNEAKTHILAFVSWFLEFEEMKEYYGAPVEVWHHTLRCPTGPASFIPVRRISSKFVHVKDRTVGGVNVVIVLPRKRTIGF